MTRVGGVSQDKPEASDATRGRPAVEAALIDAAIELLAEVGPSAMAVRDVAKRAGVNHGQIHHYFGGKRGLIRAAVAELARRHAAAMAERAGDKPFAPPLSVAIDEDYWRALVRILLDGEIELAAVEIEEGVSVPRAALRKLTELQGLDEPDIETKATLALGLSMILGWTVMEPFALMAAKVGDDEVDELREIVRRRIEKALIVPRPKP